MCLFLHKYADGTFIDYISNKYYNVSVSKSYKSIYNNANYIINITAKDIPNGSFFNKTRCYIMHNYDKHYDSFSNVIFLTPLFKPI